MRMVSSEDITMKIMNLLTFVVIALIVSVPSHAAKISGKPTYLLPMTCGELLPDPSPFIGFLDSVATGQISTDKNFSKRVYRVLALRNKLGEASERIREANPVDFLIRKTLCFYREQKEPLKPVPYDDPAFIRFFRDALKELELKIEDAIFQTEYELAQRKQYELQLQKNKDVVERIREEAEENADRSFDRLANSAKQKVKSQ